MAVVEYIVLAIGDEEEQTTPADPAEEEETTKLFDNGNIWVGFSWANLGYDGREVKFDETYNLKFYEAYGDSIGFDDEEDICSAANFSVVILDQGEIPHEESFVQSTNDLSSATADFENNKIFFSGVLDAADNSFYGFDIAFEGWISVVFDEEEVSGYSHSFAYRTPEQGVGATVGQITLHKVTSA